jgi:hypothetical protein
MMERLRKAILSDVTEDMAMLGDLTEWHTELIAAWNAVPGVEPITDADLDEQFDG